PQPITLSGTTSRGGKVSMTITENSIQGYIANGMFTFYFEPSDHFIHKDTEANTVLYNTKDIIEGQEMVCGATEQHKLRSDIDINTSKRELSIGCKEVQYAIASDFTMFQHYGSIAAVANHNIAVTNDMMTNYDNEFNDEIRFVIVQQHIVTTSASNICADSSTWNYMLNCFTSWAPSGFTTTHDLGSLWTRRATSGSTVGIAWIGAVCTNFRYNVLKDNTTNSNSKRVLLAHEIGHNFNAQHDPSGSPTIMAPSVNNTNTWSTLSQDVINAYYPSRPCLSNCTPSTPLINFEEILITTGEIGTDNNGNYCGNNFKTLNIPVYLDRATASPTTVNVSILGSTTATANVDYELLTPSLVFPLGSSGTQYVQVRIIDDAIQEPTEQIVLQISTALGPGVIGLNNICTIIINSSEDILSQTCCSPSGIKQYGSGPNALIFMFNSDYTDARNRFLYLPNQLNAAGIAAGYLTGLAFYVWEKNSTQPFNNFRIGIKNTNFTTLEGQDWISTTTVHTSNITTVEGTWTYIAFDEPFYWDGTSSLYIESCFDNTSAGSSPDYILGGDRLGSSSGRFYDIRVGSTTNCNLGSTTIFYTNNTILQPHFRFHTLDSVLVENTLNVSRKTQLKVGEKANFYSQNQRVIASIKNSGGIDLSCTEVLVATTGNTKLALSGGGNYAQKTIQVTADNISTYEISLYYTQQQ
ncbi:MAG TPA: M12 family metallo-peptidase, partial [Saprospiraceae bacterium]|nr:M12 family metallo-peptidase [Saprospiraceae bacterium]